MSGNIFFQVKTALNPRLPDVLSDLLPGGKVSGQEYICASLQGGAGKSCLTNLETGTGSDFATGDSWPDIIGLAAKIWNVRQYDAARELSRRYGLDTESQHKPKQAYAAFAPILPVPESAPEPPRSHFRYGQASMLWCYRDEQGQILGYVARFEQVGKEKVVLPLCYGRFGEQSPQWTWKALPEPRPLYGLHKLTSLPDDSPVLLVEGEKTADAGQEYFSQHVVLTWSGGAAAFEKIDFSPIYGRHILIWPDNDEPGFRAAIGIAKILEPHAQKKLRIVFPPDSLPEKWDIADPFPPECTLQQLLQQDLLVEEFICKAAGRYPVFAPLASTEQVQADAKEVELEDLTLKEWPKFSMKACPGLLGEFVRLATRDSEADPAAICITALVRFGAEVYGHALNQGPHIFVGETAHPPRLFAVICGNSSKARKGTSRYPVNRLFARDYCDPEDMKTWRPAPSARESGGPLSTGEGLAYQLREESPEERERWQRLHPHEPIREKDDKRLVIQDEEFASGLVCTKREGNTLSMGIRCFWDSGDYAPLTKNNPVVVKGAHISIITHITMQELAVALGDVQVVNGFGNRFLWICARRAKLVALPTRMAESEFAPMQRELWRLVSHAQKRGIMTMDAKARELWESVYPELSKEHTGLAGSIINRAEAQTLRLALIYALLDGQGHIDDKHLQAALAMWQYAQDSALYIFGGRSLDPLEEKILTVLQDGPITATELSARFNRHVPRERLQPLLQQLEAQQRISIVKQKGAGRPKLIISLREERELSEKRENSEKTEAST